MKQHVKGLIALACLGAMMVPSAFASNDAYSVNVTASRTEAKNFTTPADITIIDREQIENRHYSDVGEAIKDVPGVMVQNYGRSGDTYSSNRIYINGTPNVVFLIDGVRQNLNGNAGAKVQLNQMMNMNMIERIEVLKGSSSSLYGSDAAGGVINIITKKDKKPHVTTSIKGELGSSNFNQWSIQNSGAQDGWYWNIDFQKRHSHDFKDGAGHTIIDRTNAKSYGIQLGSQVSEKAIVEVNASKYKSDYTRPQNGGYTDATAIGKKEETKLAFHYNQQYTKAWNHDLVIYRNQNHIDDNITGYRWRNDVTTTGMSDQVTFTSDTHEVVAGFDYYKDVVKTKDVPGTYKGDPTISSKAFFIQDSWFVSPEWTFDTGVRFDNYSRFGNHTSWSVGLQHILSDTTNMYASYKEFFIAPSIYELFSVPSGNLSLKPEEGHTVEVGVKHQFDATTLGTITYWDRKSKNGIKWVRSHPEIPGDWSGKYHNILEEKGHGITTTLSKQLSDHVDMNVGYTYTHIDGVTGINTNRDGYIPVSAWNIGVNYHEADWTVDLTGRAVINRQGRKADPYVDKQTSYWLWNLNVNYQMSNELKVFAGINNIFNQHYTDQIYELDPVKWYAQPGRNFKAGIEYKF